MTLKKKNEEVKGKVIPEITFNNEIVIENKPIIVEIEEKLESPIIEDTIEISNEDVEEDIIVEETIEETLESPIVEDTIEITKEDVKESKIIDTSKLSKEEINILITNLGKSDYNFYRRTGIIINRQKK